jgi:hypothetical protein
MALGGCEKHAVSLGFAASNMRYSRLQLCEPGSRISQRACAQIAMKDLSTPAEVDELTAQAPCDRAAGDVGARLQQTTR